MTPPGDLKRKPANLFGIAVALWVGVVFFSSTSLAGRLSDRAFGVIYKHLVWLRRLHTNVHFMAEKSVHLVMFFVFAMLFWKAAGDSPRKVPMILGFGVLIGALAELLQRFAPGRDPAGRDVIIDFIGAALGVLTCITWRLASRPAPDLPCDPPASPVHR